MKAQYSQEIHNTMDTVEIKKLIKTTLLRKGKGVDKDPIRIITQYWNMDGSLEFEIDPLKDM